MAEINCDLIKPGETIHIPNKPANQAVTVRSTEELKGKNDSLDRIAREHHTTWQAICADPRNSETLTRKVSQFSQKPTVKSETSAENAPSFFEKALSFFQNNCRAISETGPDGSISNGIMCSINFESKF